MGQISLRNLLLFKLRPVLGLMNSCSSVYFKQYSNLIFAPIWKYSGKSGLRSTSSRISSGGYCLPCVRYGQNHVHSSLVSNCKVTALAPSQIVMSSCLRQYSSSSEKKQESADEPDQPVAPERLSLFKRFKQMYRDYWYVLIPVHVVTSVGWFGAFYYMCVSGVDVVAVLESLNISEKIINPLRDSKAGYVALSYALYKIATPLRYTVTLGGTTVSINYLKKWGYIKPIPPREKLKEMYDEKKENLIERKDALIKETTEQLKERKDSFMKSYRGNK